MRDTRKKNLLIISSERLNKAEILPSIFELNQAKALSRSYSVAILAVDHQWSFRRIVGHPLRQRFSWVAFREAFRRLAQRFVKVKLQSIQGIRVIEARSEPEPRKQAVSWGSTVARFIASGGAGFKTYVDKYGLPDLIHAHGRFLLAGELARRLKLQYKIPFVYSEHCSFYREGIAPVESANTLRAVLELADKVTVPSPSVISDLVRFSGLSHISVEVLPNMVDSVFEEYPLRLNSPDNAFRFVCVASLEPNKQVDILLRAFALLALVQTPVELTIIGEGPERASLAGLVSNLGLGRNVRFMGRIGAAGVLQEIDRAHVLVLVSKVETFGVVVLEALMRGRPVVATRCGGPESIINNLTGKLVEVGDIVQLAGAMQSYMDNSNRNAVEIRNYALQNFSRRRFLERLERIYANVVA